MNQKQSLDQTLNTFQWLLHLQKKKTNVLEAENLELEKN